jgi:tRNA nucleotidyltransferase/poly(A) polymerase
MENKEVRMKMYFPTPKNVCKFYDIFKKNNHKIFMVGGSVRDVFIGLTPKDFDLVTDAIPDKVISLLKNEMFVSNILETGKSFGVINVITTDGEYEIATMRKDIGAGRRPESVEFTDIKGDLTRRDLTINALFYDIETGEVVDLVGGINDLKNGVVRTVGAPEDRFGEDRLRILRAIRFAGRFGSDLDPAVDAALQKDASLEGISGERIRDEFIKGLASAKSTKYYLELIDKYGLFNSVFKGLDVNKRFIDNDDPIVLISMLLSGNDLSVLAKKLNELKYSSDEVKKITTLIAMFDLGGGDENVKIAPKLKKLFINSGLTNGQLRNFGSNMGINSQLLDSFEEYLKLPNVTELEVREKYPNIKPGPDFGVAKNNLEIERFKDLI